MQGPLLLYEMSCFEFKGYYFYILDVDHVKIVTNLREMFEENVTINIILALLKNTNASLRT